MKTNNSEMVAGWVVRENGSERWGKVEEVRDGKALVFFRGASPQWVPVDCLTRI